MTERPDPVPGPIVTYYRRCVAAPPSTPRGCFVEQTGELRFGPERGWMPFTAEQTSSAERVAFRWHARFKMAPLVTGVVEDAYEEGHGRLDAKLWGVLPVAHGRGLEIDRGEAQRYLAELVWCPMALLYNTELNFRPISTESVRVWVRDEETHVDLRFDPSGDIVGAKTTTRARGDVVQPWEGRFWAYKDFDGLRAPARAEVWWETPEGPFVYWHGTVTSLRWAE